MADTWGDDEKSEKPDPKFNPTTGRRTTPVQKVVKDAVKKHKEDKTAKKKKNK